MKKLLPSVLIFSRTTIKRDQPLRIANMLKLTSQVSTIVSINVLDTTRLFSTVGRVKPQFIIIDGSYGQDDYEMLRDLGKLKAKDIQLKLLGNDASIPICGRLAKVVKNMVRQQNTTVTIFMDEPTESLKEAFGTLSITVSAGLMRVPEGEKDFADLVIEGVATAKKVVNLFKKAGKAIERHVAAA